MRYAIASRLKRTGTAFPLYKKERERRSRAFPSDSNPANVSLIWKFLMKKERRVSTPDKELSSPEQRLLSRNSFLHIPQFNVKL